MADIKHNQGEAGGYLVGRRHSTGGIKAVNKSTGQPLEMEGGEVVITRDAVSDSTKRSFNGKMMTNRQILSEINQSGGGVAFADGGELPETMHFDGDAEYEYGGDTMCGCDLATKMTATKSFEDGGETAQDNVSYGFRFAAVFLDKDGNPQSIVERSFIDVWELIQNRFSNGSIQDTTDIVFKLSVNVTNITQNNEDNFELIYLDGQNVPMKDLFDVYYDDFIDWFASKLVEVNPETAEVYRQNTQQYLVYTGTSYNTSDFMYLERFAPNSSREKLTIQIYSDPTREGQFREKYPESVNFNTLYEDNSLMNYKRWEKFGKDVNKRIDWDNWGTNDLLIGSPVRSILATAEGENRVRGFFSVQVPNKDLSKIKKEWTKWDWWKKEVLTHGGTFIGELEVRLSHKPSLKFRNVDFTAYECDFNVVRKGEFGKRSQPNRDKISDAIEKVLEKTKDVLINQRRYGSLRYFNATKAIVNNPRRFFSTDVNFAFTDAKGDTWNYDSNVRQEYYLFASDVAAFYFSNYSSWILGGDPEAREEAQKNIALALAEAKAAKEAERQAQKAAEEAERLRKEELKNREWQVRDQPEDAEVWPETFDSPEIIKAEKDLAAIGKLVTLASGFKNADMRRALLRKAQGLQKRVNNLKLEANAIEQGIDSKKLNTPLGLISYYYNQARQSPVKRMGEPCGLSTPTGVPSKLDVQAYYAVRTTYFKKWFGDWEQAAATGDYSNCSLLVDEDTKEPRIMYHGVRRFDPRVQTGAMGSGITRPFGEFNPPNFPATYFGDSLAYVDFYAGQAENQPKVDPNYEGFIYSVFINMRNPIRLQGLGLYSSYKDLLAYVAIKYGIVVKPSQELLTKIQGEKKRLKVWNYVRNDFNLILTLKKAGYDGIIQYGDVPKFNVEGQPSGMFEEKEYLVFEPNQVKSAVVKKSFYLPQFNDIRFKDGGNVRI
jgi:hypothetical protein